jgi:hypothetical protein
MRPSEAEDGDNNYTDAAKTGNRSGQENRGVMSTTHFIYFKKKKGKVSLFGRAFL